MERRTFMTRITGLIAGLIGFSLSIPLVGYVISPALRRLPRDWAEVGGVQDLPVGEPKEFSYIVSQQDGWLKTTAVKSVWAVRESVGPVTVFSPLCPHLGCGYRWDSSERHFKCPCHNSVFDITGKVLGGPAPRPLDRLPMKVEEDRIFVVYKEFKAGSPTQTEL